MKLSGLAVSRGQDARARAPGVGARGLCAPALDSGSGRLGGARWCPSPHRDARPDPADISLVVVHGISLPPGEFGGDWIDALFTGTLPADAHPYFAGIAAMRVSSHVLIRRDGGYVQYVPFHERAWHAGVSSFDGRPGCNDYSIGIELEGTDEDPYETMQYRRLAALCAALMRAYPAVTEERIVGHCHVAPGRKTDPGPAFEWNRLRRLIRAVPA